MCTGGLVFWQSLSCMEMHLEKMVQIFFFIERQAFIVIFFFFNFITCSKDRRLILSLLNYFVIFSSLHTRHKAHKSHCETKLCTDANVKIWQLLVMVI